MYKDNTQEPEVARNLNSEIRRFHIINYIIEKYKFKRYLEIGVFTGENIREIKVAFKEGVDPGAEGFILPEVNYPVTSDQFFDLVKEYTDMKYDIIFIDGLHEYSQVKKDIENSLKHLQPYGFIVMHDCNPASFESQTPERTTVAWNGDTWKAFVEFRANNPAFESGVIDTDFGVGFIKNASVEVVSGPVISLDYQSFDLNREEYLNLMSYDEFLEKY